MYNRAHVSVTCPGERRHCFGLSVYFYPLYGVWKGISFAVFLLCPVRYLADGGNYRCKILHNGTYVSRMSSPLLGAVPQESSKSEIFRLKFQQFDREYLENGTSQRCMSKYRA